MKKQEKIKALEAEYDNLVDQLRSPQGCPDRISIMITKEIIQAQLTALQLQFDDDPPTLLEPENEIDFKFTLDVDCDPKDKIQLKDTVTSWFLRNLPSTWPETDAVINSIRI